MQTRHSFLVYNMADWSNRRYGDTLRHAAVWSSAKPTPHSTILRSPTNIHVHQLRLRLTLPNRHTDVFKLRHTMTSKISPVTRHRTDNNKHNDTINLHAQNCCTHKLHTQTHPKISQNVYKSKRNLVAKWCVRITHIIHYDYCWSTHGGTITQPINTIWAKSYAHNDSAIISHWHWQ